MGVVDADVDGGVNCCEGVDQAPPSVAAASNTQQRNPLASKCLAVTSPADPAPMTATSIIVWLML